EGATDVDRGATEAAHLGLVRGEDAEAVRADDACPAEPGELDHLRHLAARDALGDDDEEPDAGLDRLEDRIAREARRDGDDRAIDVAAFGDLADAVIDRH